MTFTGYGVTVNGEVILNNECIHNNELLKCAFTFTPCVFAIQTMRTTGLIHNADPQADRLDLIYSLAGRASESNLPHGDTETRMNTTTLCHNWEFP